MAGHSDRLKQWYKDNPEAAEEMAESRNKVLRTDAHRQKMSKRTADYIANNPEEDRKRRDKANESKKKTAAGHNEIKQKCLKLVQDRLLELSEIKNKKDIISMAVVEGWRRKGLIKKHFPTLPVGYVPIERWQEFLELIFHKQIGIME